MTVSERERLPVENDDEISSSDYVNHLIRAKPNVQSGTVSCSFVLSGGHEVAVRFVLLKGAVIGFVVVTIWLALS